MPGIMTYLESADSTRVPYEASKQDEKKAEAETNKAQIHLFLEMVAVLSMGRQIVVPQSFAFDSYIFQRAATRVWKAFEQAGSPGEPPIRLHLFGAKSFEDSIAQNIYRTKENGDSFRSSLFPELNANFKEWDLNPTDGSKGILRALPDGDARKEIFLQTVTKFEYATSNPFARPPKYGTLSEQLTEVIYGQTLTHDPVLRTILRDAYDTLNLSQYHLRARSDLRSNEAWPGTHSGKSARSLVGDEALNILTEVVDTLYNKTVAWTTGARYQVYSTRLAGIGKSLHRAGRAQSAAVESGDSSSTDDGTAFDLRLESLGPLRQEEIGDFLLNINRNKELIDGLTSLFRARADDTSEFQDSLKAIAHASDPVLRTKRVRQHVHVVARTLGHGYETKPSDLQWAGIGLGFTATATSGNLVLNPPTDLLGAVILGIIAVGGTATSLRAPLRVANERQKVTRCTERALASMLREDA